MATNSPSPTVKSIPSSATTVPRGVPYSLRRPFTAITSAARAIAPPRLYFITPAAAVFGGAALYGPARSAARYTGAMDGRERALAEAFDGQAARFERAPVQTDPAALARMVEFAGLQPDSRVLDAGCGPGLVAEAYLAAGHRVHGVDLAGEMVRRARERCARFGARARFEQGPVSALASDAPFDAAVSRFVVHHAPDPVAFLRAKAERVRPGGVVLATDHVTDPDGPAARWHQEIERARDRTHERSLTPGELADAFGRAGLSDVQLV